MIFKNVSSRSFEICTNVPGGNGGVFNDIMGELGVIRETELGIALRTEEREREREKISRLGERLPVPSFDQSVPIKQQIRPF
jgi:hypothetical protein